MQKQHLIVLLIVFTLAGVGLGFWIYNKSAFCQKSPQKVRKIAVLCTTSLIADAAKEIGGDRIAIRALMGPGVDPHLYRARESDIQALIDADIIFYNGLHLEGKMGELLEKMRSWKTVVAVSDCISKEELRASEFVGLYDPHIWHEVSLWRKVITYMGKVLSDQYPDCCEYFHNRTLSYARQLDELEQWIQKEISLIPAERKILATAHDAFGYFGRAYHFEVVGLQGMSTDAEISASDIQYLVSYLVDHQVPVIFVESSIASRSIQAVERACAYRNWPITIGDELYSDALSDESGPAVSYIHMMKHNVMAMIKGLTL